MDDLVALHPFLNFFLSYKDDGWVIMAALCRNFCYEGLWLLRLCEVHLKYGKNIGINHGFELINIHWVPMMVFDKLKASFDFT